MSNYFNGSGTIGFTCDNCGREMQGCTWVNGMKFCAKCYQETFGNTNPFEKELRDKIADLEAKLAESEESREKAYQEGFLQKQFDKDMEIMQLKQQLAKKDEENENLKDCWNVLCDYLGDCIIKFDKEDTYGIYSEVLDKVNILKRYDYKRHQSKISFCIEQLEKVKDMIYRFDVSCDEINNLTIALDNYTNGFHKAKFKATILIDNQIKQLKGVK